VTLILQPFRNLYRYQTMILALAARDLQSRYAGTLAGILWAFVHPVAVIFIFYFVFAIGFRSQGPDSTPFILWFVSGFVPWLFFNESLTSITDSVIRNAHFIKKTVFPSEVLAAVHLTASLVPHAVFTILLAAMLVYYDVAFHLSMLLMLYFVFCTCVLVMGLGWLLSAVQVFYRDVSHGLGIGLNLLFWVTPIVWSPDNLPEQYQPILRYNPLGYIIQGYRGVLVTHQLPDVGQTVFFWSIALLLFMTGAYVFGRLKPEFADVM
jgi:lipopolysaccharide transport system permease protein/teichoic acid transport system permease protein